MVTLKVQARGDGRVVSWSGLKQGRLVDVSRLGTLFFSTTLTDVVADLCSLALSLDRDYRLEMIVPNGPTTASYNLALIGDRFQIVCSRRLVRGWFPLNPLAAEWGKNYDVVVTVHANANETESRVTAMLTSKYRSHRVN